MSSKLDYASRHIMLDYLFNRAKDDGRPLAICIVDDSGWILEAVLMDGAPKRMLKFGFHKAYTAAIMGRETADLRSHMESRGSVDVFCDPNLTVLRGGTPILNKDGEIIGAIGMSGWKSEEDQELANEAAALLNIT